MSAVAYLAPIALLAVLFYRSSVSKPDFLGIVLLIASAVPLIWLLGAVKGVIVWLALLSLAGLFVVLAVGLKRPKR